MRRLCWWVLGLGACIAMALGGTALAQRGDAEDQQPTVISRRDLPRTGDPAQDEVRVKDRRGEELIFDLEREVVTYEDGRTMEEVTVVVPRPEDARRVSEDEAR